MSATPDRVDDAVLDDLRNRLRATRSVTIAGTAGWARGPDPGYLAELVAYWQDGYDWRTHENRLRALPWVAAGETGRRGMRAVRQRGRRADRGPPARVARLVPPVRQGPAAAHRPRRRRAVPAGIPVVPSDGAGRHVDAGHGRPCRRGAV